MRPAVLALFFGCGDGRRPSHPADAGVDAGRDRWTGRFGVLVVDGDGAPVEGAIAVVGGRPPQEWVTTDAQGRAELELFEMPGSERWATAGKRGYFNGGVELDDVEPPAGDVVITVLPLPAEDNVDYPYQPGGHPGHAEDASFCMHCHVAIGETWNASRHSIALSNEHTRDLFNGSALLATESGCGALGGRWEESGVPGSEAESIEDHCTVGRGVLPDLDEACGGAGQTPCDHPELDRAAMRLGGCGDCHGAAIPFATPGAVDLNDARGETYLEGVSCDFCHKIDDVVVGPAPGLDGAIRLRRPSQPSEIAALEYAPIMFGPYPDVLLVVMGASYNPQFREGGLCSGCHEYAQPALDPEDGDVVDAAKWPDGVPVHTTYSEWATGPVASVPCQDCHMPVLDQDSSTFPLAENDVEASLVAGWLRADGEVRRHDWPSVARLAPSALQAGVALEDLGGAIEATVTIRNLGAGHALPTGDPLRQVLVLVDGTIDGASVPAIGGRAVPDVGGYSARGVVGTDASVAGRDVTIPGAVASAGVVRFVRPTGEWDDYDGPGVGWLSAPERTAIEKGLPIFEVLGEVAVASVAGDVVTLAGDPPPTLPGDVVYACGDGEWAGAAGWLFTKVLVDRDGERGVHHYRAVDVASDNRIAAGASATTSHRFPTAPAGSTLRVSARVVYRRYADAVARVYGWPREDLAIRSATGTFSP